MSQIAGDGDDTYGTGPDAGFQRRSSAFQTTGKRRLLQDASEMIAGIYGHPAEEVFQAFLERERLGTTGVGQGVAIPHVRLACVDGIKGFFLRLDKPVDFGAVDRQPVDLVFGLLAPQDADAAHLRALARVSRRLRDRAIREKLRSTFDPSAIYSILIDEQVVQAA